MARRHARCLPRHGVRGRSRAGGRRAVARLRLRARVPLPGTEGLLPPAESASPFERPSRLRRAGSRPFALRPVRVRERFREPLARLMVPALFFQLLALSSVYFLSPEPEVGVPALGAGPLPPDRCAALAVVAGVARPALSAAAAARRHRGSGRSGRPDRRRDRAPPVDGVEVAGVVGEGTSPREDLRLLGPMERLAEIVLRGKAVDEVILTPEAVAWRETRSRSRMPADGRRGPARLAVAFRDDDRAPALPDRRGPAAARGPGAPLRGRGGTLEARFRRLCVAPECCCSSAAAARRGRGGGA